MNFSSLPAFFSRTPGGWDWGVWESWGFHPPIHAGQRGGSAVCFARQQQGGRWSVSEGRANCPGLLREHRVSLPRRWQGWGAARSAREFFKLHSRERHRTSVLAAGGVASLTLGSKSPNQGAGPSRWGPGGGCRGLVMNRKGEERQICVCVLSTKAKEVMAQGFPGSPWRGCLGRCILQLGLLSEPVPARPG